MSVAANEIDVKLRSEVLSLFQYIQRLRQEIAAMSKPDDKGTAFENMSLQLGAIVEATESATNTILKASESIENAAAKLRKKPAVEETVNLCATISGQVTEIMEACTFQDITGQRVTKIVGSVRFVEERINVMVDLWGRGVIEALGTEAKDAGLDTGELKLEGPQLSGEGISQEEIDALFD